MVDTLLEVCVDSVASAEAAAEGGAARIELCSALSEGGLTPTLGLLKTIKKRVRIPVFCMVRPRGGPMVYSSAEEEVMLSDARDLKYAGADGLVFGALTSQGNIHIEFCKSFREVAGDMPCTFHRAFDLLDEPLLALDTLIELGFTRILTSGGAVSAIAGTSTLFELHKIAGSRIIIMAGAGVRSSNVAALLAKTGVFECHASARVK
ncbi:unnamed protein product, partial [Meganyctiphanes norvegica]